MARAPLAWHEYLCTVLLSCRVVPACLEPAWRGPVQHTYSHKEHGDPGPYSLSCSHRNHCQNFSGFLFEKNQVFRECHRGYPSGNVAVTWLAISSWLVILLKLVLFLLGADCCYMCRLPQMQSSGRSFRHNLSSARMTQRAPGLLVQGVSFALMEWMSMLRSHMIQECGPCPGGMVGSAMRVVFSLFFTRCNISSMTAKSISWILHTAPCIILLATNSGSAIHLLSHVLQEVFETASQTKWEERVQGQSFHICNTESRLNVKGRTSDISSKCFSLTKPQSSLKKKMWRRHADVSALLSSPPACCQRRKKNTGKVQSTRSYCTAGEAGREVLLDAQESSQATNLRPVKMLGAHSSQLQVISISE